MKKILSLVLSLLLMISIYTPFVYAEESNDSTTLVDTNTLGLEIKQNTRAGLDIECTGADTSACEYYLNTLQWNEASALEIIDLDTNKTLIKISYADEGSSLFTMNSQTLYNVRYDVLIKSPEQTFKNKNTKVVISAIPGYTSFETTINPLTIAPYDGHIDQPIEGCELTLSGDNYVITCNKQLFNASNDYNFGLLIDSLKINLNRDIVQSTDGYTANIAKEAVESKAFAEIVTEVSTIKKPLLVLDNGGLDRTYYSLGDFDLSNARKALPEGLFVVPYNEDTEELKIVCSSEDSENCKAYLQSLLDTAKIEDTNNFYKNYDNSYIELSEVRKGPPSNTTKHYTLPKEVGNCLFDENESVDDHALVITGKTFNVLNVEPAEYRVNIKTNGYPVFRNPGPTAIKNPKEDLGAISATAKQDMDSMDLIVQFSAETTDEYFNTITYFWHSAENSDHNTSGYIPAIDLDKKQIVFKYDSYSNWISGKGILSFTSSKYKILNVDVTIEKTKKAATPADLRFLFSTKGLYVATTNKEFLEDATSREALNQLPAEHLDKHGVTTLGFSSMDEQTHHDFSIDLYDKKYEVISESNASETEYAVLIPFEEIKYDIKEIIDYGLSEAKISLTTPLYTKNGTSKGKTLSDWYDMMILLEDVLNGKEETTVTDNELEDAMNNAGIDVDADVSKENDAEELEGLSFSSYLAQVVDVQNKNGKGFTENGRIEVTVDIKKGDENLLEGGSDADDEADLSNLRDTGLSFKIDILYNYFVEKTDQEATTKEEIENLVFPAELLLEDLPFDQLQEDEVFLLLTEHDGVKKTIEIQIVGNDGKVKIQEFSPFQLVIKEKADVDTDTDADADVDKDDDRKPSSSSNKDYIVVNTAVK